MREYSVHKLNTKHSGFVVWHPDVLKLVYVSGDPFSTDVNCAILDVSLSAVVSESELTINMPSKFYEIRSIAHHEMKPYLLIIGETSLLIWDYEQNQMIATAESLPPIKGGGFFLDEANIWTLSESDSGCVDWGIWNYQTNSYNVYEMERYEHYSRGAVLHPSGVLIGALWNAYECGYHIHKAFPDNGKLSYFTQPSPERPEYEAYEPTFSPEGKLLAFFANPYLAWHENLSRICVYDITTATLLREIITETSLVEQQLQFAHDGTTIAFYENPTHIVYIFDVNTGKNLATIPVSSKIRNLACHKHYEFYAVAHEKGHEKGLDIYFDSDSSMVTSSINYQRTADNVAATFVENNKDNCVAVGKGKW